MNQSKSIVLLSSGLDSTLNLFLAHKKSQVVQTLTFNYGQRALAKEVEYSKKLSDYLNISHMVIDLPWLKNIGSSSLNNSQFTVPTGKAVSIADHAVSTQTAKSVWVPNRNGVFLNIAACLAEAAKADQIIAGFNLEEAATFPDNSEAFIEAATKSFEFSTSNHVKVVSYTVKMHKTEIMKTAVDEKVPFNLIWPCYFSYDQWCGECESCLRTKRAMIQNNIATNKFFAE
ncbi:MAG: 7-cyano-7-deazaguanine synthase QueC [Bdellovibrionaceae bacterium]|nr:7-cyano-7-deazaguanine synthase QueC [Pseudobdellovibrionaceae bacterium]